MGLHGRVSGHPDTKKPMSSDSGLKCLHALFDELTHKARVGDALLFSDFLKQGKLRSWYPQLKTRAVFLNFESGRLEITQVVLRQIDVFDFLSGRQVRI